MNPTRYLKNEHNTIKRILSMLLRICNRLEPEKHIDEEHLRRIVDFIGAFADAYQHENEEDLLFPLLEESGFRRNWGALAEIASEHEEVRRSLGHLCKAVCDYRKGEKNAPERILTRAREYIPFLMAHIQKEDMGLIHAADGLPDEIQNKLMKNFERDRGPDNGFKRQKNLKRLLYRCERIYAG
ncbi:MAG TPA: hemerythrin domain-containing protein [Syntrophorhabdaceae bacterium]|nr:hemerythrin domain-containing protein [Syntrophorhabdaceae bacterium]